MPGAAAIARGIPRCQRASHPARRVGTAFAVASTEPSVTRTGPGMGRPAVAEGTGHAGRPTCHLRPPQRGDHGAHRWGGPRRFPPVHRGGGGQCPAASSLAVGRVRTVRGGPPRRTVFGCVGQLPWLTGRSSAVRGCVVRGRVLRTVLAFPIGAHDASPVPGSAVAFCCRHLGVSGGAQGHRDLGARWAGSAPCVRPVLCEANGAPEGRPVSGLQPLRAEGLAKGSVARRAPRLRRARAR